MSNVNIANPNDKKSAAIVTDLEDVQSSSQRSLPSFSGDRKAAADAMTAAADEKIRQAALAAGIDEKKLMRKIDIRLIPWLSVLYLLSFLDRSAIGFARLYGIRETLNMTTAQLNIAISIFFFPYALFEVPSNILLKRLRPSVWFPLITFLVGACMLSQGVVSSYGGLCVARVFLGITEAGLFPGANFQLAGWYRRKEFGLRAAIFFSAATVSGAFGGLLSAAIHNMEGVGGYEGWRWIFILIGLATCLVGFASIWLCQDFPETAKFLTEAERTFVIQRLQADQQFSAAGESFKWDNLWKAVVDWKTWVGMMIYAGVDGPLYAFSIFTPNIVQQLGYTATRASLISVPIYAFACIVTVIIGFAADRKGNRALFNMALISVGIAGYIILAASRVPGLSYFAIYLAAAGIYPCIPNTIALTSTSIEGIYKRSVVMGWIISFGNINGAATTNVYQAKAAPWYSLGHGIIVLYLAIGWIASFIYYIGLRRENSRRARGLCDETILLDEEEHEQNNDAATPTSLQQQQQQQKAAAVAATEASHQHDAGVTDLSALAADNSTHVDQSKHADLLKRAADARAELEQKDRQSGMLGKLRAIRRRYGEADGGVYATHAEARAIKGDAYSRFIYHT